MEDAYSVDNNVIKWSGFYNSEEEAQKDLEQKLQKFSLKKKIVSAKKELQIKRRDNDLIYKLKEVQKTREIKKMLLYKFTIVTAPKD
jgi:ABC-type siderophore export system fused ATPase/permease subunit